jgi:hypothetical protein
VSHEVTIKGRAALVEPWGHVDGREWPDASRVRLVIMTGASGRVEKCPVKG